MKARCWYHCTDRRYDQRWTADRRPPLIHADTEPTTPRLCVAPSVAQALAAVWWSKDVAVYITPSRRTNPPIGVGDAILTGERWIVPPVELHLLTILPAHAILAAQFGLEPDWNHDYNTRWFLKTKRFINFTRVVADHFPEARERWVERFAQDAHNLFTQRIREAA